MTFSMSKLKSFLPGLHSANHSSSKRHSISLEPEVGFQLILEPDISSSGGNANRNGSESAGNFGDKQTVPELNVHLIGARHLPSIFGLKTVQGYVIKVKLFPGSKRFDSSIQTSSWPKFNENFKFPMGSQIKSSIKRQNKDPTIYQNLPQKLFKGHFVVFTVFALLELPEGYGFNRFKSTYRSLRSKGTSLLNNKSDEQPIENLAEEKGDKAGVKLTKSEMKRNIGSVTCFLDPKIFNENPRTGQFVTEELWLPIKDITVTPTKGTTVNVNSSPKGQIELILEVCETSTPGKETPPQEKDEAPGKMKENSTSQKKQWNLSEMKKKIKSTKSSKSAKGLCLKVTTSKMRCSIKVKEELEGLAIPIYVKTSVFEHEILSNSWKCDPFAPSLSIRWDTEASALIIPLVDECSLENISIRTTVATKTKVGKKIIHGTVIIGPSTLGNPLEHWKEAVYSRNNPITMWHSFQ